MRHLSIRWSRALGQSLALSIVLSLSAAPLHAQTAEDSAAAQGLFDSAKALMAQGRMQEACPKLEESQRLEPRSGTELNLARCYELTGRLASAWTKYLEAAALSRSEGNEARENGARDLATALAPRVPKLVVQVAPEARLPDLMVSRDDSVVGPPQWGTEIPVDAGRHKLFARAPGHRYWQTVTVVQGEGTTTTVTVPRLVESSASHAPRTAAGTGLGTQRILALVAGGVGVVGLGVGTGFGVAAMSKHSDAEKGCTGTACTTAAAANAGNEAHDAGNIATIGLIVGAVGVAAGVTLWFTAPAPVARGEIALGPGTIAFKEVF